MSLASEILAGTKGFYMIWEVGSAPTPMAIRNIYREIHILSAKPAKANNIFLATYATSIKRQKRFGTLEGFSFT